MKRRGGNMAARRILLLLGTLLALGACNMIDALDLFGGPTKKPLPGDRISVLALEHNLEPDPAIASLYVKLPRPEPNEDWPEAERKRHLLRLWLSPPGARPLPPVFAECYGDITIGDRGGIICKGTRLHAPLVPG